MESGTMYAQIWGFPSPEKAGLGSVSSIGEFNSRIQELINLFERLRVKLQIEYKVEQIHQDKVRSPFRDRIVSATIWRKDGGPITCNEVERLL